VNEKERAVARRKRGVWPGRKRREMGNAIRSRELYVEQNKLIELLNVTGKCGDYESRNPTGWVWMGEMVKWVGFWGRGS